MSLGISGSTDEVSGSTGDGARRADEPAGAAGPADDRRAPEHTDPSERDERTEQAGPTPHAGLTKPPATRYTRIALWVLAAMAIFSITLDQVTKHLAAGALDDREPVRLLGGGVYLVLTRNSGAAFSLASEYTFVFPAIAAAVVLWIVWMSRRLRSVPWAIALGLVLGGALGNLTDRMFRAPGPFVGHVVDFISLFDDHGQVWPVFNVADMSLVGGVALAILLELTGRRRDGTREAGRTTDAAEPAS